MNLNTLTAISPIDGRYRSKAENMADYFSEYALIKARVNVEIEYFIALCELPLPQLNKVEPTYFDALRKVAADFSEDDARHIKDTERITNHDVKAVEYFVKEKLVELGLEYYKEFVHFGLTSQDINNTAMPLLLRSAHLAVVLPQLNEVQNALLQRAKEWSEYPMLAHTHGQPASPSNMGKEVYVFYERLKNQIELLNQIPFGAKFGGATGNFNAHYVAYPSIDWVAFGNKFVNDTLHLRRLQTTTQIEHYDYMAAYFDCLKRINTILIDLDRDMWTYNSMKYFRQKVKKGEVGSSAMPHKVNPIDFENSEGNLGIANALFEHFARKLPISRLQRDLTDSTVTRNIGVPLAHSLIGWKSMLTGLGKLMLNADILNRDLEDNWAVVAEAIQTILRREGYPNPYETLKELTRGNDTINKESIQRFIATLNVSDAVKQELMKITPQNYTGILRLPDVE